MNIKKIKKDNIDYISMYFFYLNDVDRGRDDLFFIYKELFKEKVEECVDEFERNYYNKEISLVMNRIKEYCENYPVKTKTSPDESETYFYNKDNMSLGKIDESGWTIYKEGIKIIEDSISKDIPNDTFIHSKIGRKFIEAMLQKRLSFIYRWE